MWFSLSSALCFNYGSCSESYSTSYSVFNTESGSGLDLFSLGFVSGFEFDSLFGFNSATYSRFGSDSGFYFGSRFGACCGLVLALLSVY